MADDGNPHQRLSQRTPGCSGGCCSSGNPPGCRDSEKRPATKTGDCCAKNPVKRCCSASSDSVGNEARGSGDHDHEEHSMDDCESHTSQVSECCSDAETCVCNEGCQVNYASLLHQQSGCKRAALETVSPTSSSDNLIANGNSKSQSRRKRLSCAHCLRNAKDMSSSLAGNAKACYCKLTRSLCKSVKSLATVEFSYGCCQVEAIREKREHGNDHDGHDHDGCEGHDHGHHHEKLFQVIEEDPSIAVTLNQPTRFSRHVALGVAGMHCTSCAEEVAGVIRHIIGVERNGVQVSFVLSRAEFAYDPEIIKDVDEQIISKILKRFRRLDVVTLVDTDVGDEASGIMRVRMSAQHGSVQGMADALANIPGIESVTVVASKEIEVAYDPDRVGIRTVLRLLRRGGAFGEIRLDDVPDGSVLAQQAEARHLRIIAIQTILAAILTIPVLVLAWSGNLIQIDKTTRLSIECACATAIIFVAYNIYLDALWAAWYGNGLLEKINMDTLVSVATLAAYGFSVAVFAVDRTGSRFGDGEEKEPFFETSTLLTTLILAGRWLTAGVRNWASRKLRTIGDGDLQTTDVRLYDPEQKAEIYLDARELEYGDTLVATQGERVATDGLVVDGTGQLDESHLTGEPKPQHKSQGSFLLAGSTVVSGAIKYRVSKLLQENTISSIKGMVKLASQQKPRKQQLADRIAAILTPTVFCISCLVFLIWILIGGLIRKVGWSQSAVTAATYAVATLAISCPCAIALAVPMVMAVSSRVGVIKGGFVFKNPAAVEKGPRVGKVVFDKTGTLTTGHLHVDRALVRQHGQWSNQVPVAIWRVLYQLCRTSSHPVARAMFQLASESHIHVQVNGTEPAVEVEDVVSKGIQGRIDGYMYRGGKLSFTAPDSVDDPAVNEKLRPTQSVFTLSRDYQLLAIFSLKDDKIRPEVPAVLKALRDQSIEIFIFSGDRSEAVTPIARELGIPASNVYADCYPEDKRARLEILKKPSKQISYDSLSDEGASSPLSVIARIQLAVTRLYSRYKGNQPGTVVFIGDGTNDAIALAAADIGISLSQATDMASNAADVAILSDSISGLVGFIALSKRIDFCIKVNFAWALVWNLFAILGTSGAWVTVRISPEWAGLGEIGSVLPVFIVSALVGWRYRGFEE